MKIRFLLTNAYGGGGTTRTILNTAGALAARGHEVEVVSVLRERDRPQFAFPDGVPVEVLNDTSDAAARGRGPIARVRAAADARHARRPSRLMHPADRRYKRYNALIDRRLAPILRATDADVLVATRPGLNLMAARLADRGTVLVGQEHLNLDLHARKRPEILDVYRRFYPRLDLFTTLTEGDAEAYRDLLGDAVEVTSMPNAVPSVVGARRADPDAKRVIAAGRLTGQKGFDRLLPAFAQVAGDRSDWSLVIYGRGPAEDKLQAQIDDLGIGGQVALGGFTDDLPDEMAASSIFAMSSRFEGFPMVMLEAMAVGLPAVTFDFPTGARDLVETGRNGILVDDGDIDGLARGMANLMDDPDLRRRYGAAALETAEGYTSEAIAERWEHLLTDLVDVRARS